MAEEHYYESMLDINEGGSIATDMNCIGAGIGGGFVNTKELHMMKYKQAMATKDIKHWEQAVDKEHDRQASSMASYTHLRHPKGGQDHDIHLGHEEGQWKITSLTQCKRIQAD